MSGVAEAVAPTGTLRVGVWTVPYFAIERAGTLEGLVPDLGTELARRAGVPLELQAYENPGRLTEAFRTGGLDVTFIGITADRAEVIDFGPTVFELQTSYLVSPSSAITAIDQIDRLGVRIAVPARSAQEAHLRKTIEKATLIPIAAESPRTAIDMLTSGAVDVFSHVVAMLASGQPELPGSHILAGSYFNVAIAIGAAKGRPQNLQAWVREFVEDMKASGFVQASITRWRVKGAVIAS